MRFFPKTSRLLRISRILARYRLDEITHATHLYRATRLIRILAPWGRKGVRDQPLGRRLRLALQELGPIFVKFGQVLSTRRDMLPHHIADELALLQDKVEPFCGNLARTMVADSLDESMDAVFDEFNTTPLASASIAQVHAATLKDGSKVVVKVLRPNVNKEIRQDVELLHALARMASRYSPEIAKLKPDEFVDEFEVTIFDELDLQREAANASLMGRNFADSEEVKVPEIFWDHSSERVLVMERVYGIPIGDMDALDAAGVDRQKLSKLGVKVFYTQVFAHNFFHADMHPGNIVVDASDPANPGLILLDFGIVGSLNPSDQRYIAENFDAFFERDYLRVAQLHIDAAWVPSHTRVEELESATRTICEPYFSRPLEEISFGEVLVKLFAVAEKFDLDIQPQLILLQKTLLNIEGLGRELNPKLNIWETAQPVLKEIMQEKYGMENALKGLRRRLPGIVEKAPDLPGLIHDLLQKSVNGTASRAHPRNLDKQESVPTNGLTRGVFFGLLGTGLLIAASILYIGDDALAPHWRRLPLFPLVSLFLAFVAYAAAWPGRK